MLCGSHQFYATHLGSHLIEVIGQLIFGGADVPFPAGFQTWSTRSTEYLQHIENGQVDKSTTSTVVNLRALDQHYKQGCQRG